MAKKQDKKPDITEIERKNKKMFFTVILGVFGLVALTFATPPLYNLFCRITGYGGTTQRAEAVPEHAAIDRDITIRFDTNISRKLDWKFESAAPSLTLKIGADGYNPFRVENLSSERLAGIAAYNVSPPKAGKYFSKVECFCFLGQVLEPGEKNEMGVSFYVDPAMADDPYMDDVSTITLSYTYFPADPDNIEAERARFSDSEGRMKSLDETKI